MTVHLAWSIRVTPCGEAAFTQIATWRVIAMIEGLRRINLAPRRRPALRPTRDGSARGVPLASNPFPLFPKDSRKDRVDRLEVVIGVELLGQFSGRDFGADLGIGLQQFQQRQLPVRFPDLHRG